MKLNQLDKDILSILDDNTIESIMVFAKNRLSATEKDVKQVIDKLLSLKLVEIVNLPGPKENEKIEVLFRTNKVTSDMLNDNLRYESDTGAKFGINSKDHPIAQLRAFQKDQNPWQQLTFHPLSNLLQNHHNHDDITTFSAGHLYPVFQEKS